MKKIPLKETDPDLCLKVTVTILLDSGAVFICFCLLEMSVVTFFVHFFSLHCRSEFSIAHVTGWTREQKPDYFRCGKEEKYKSILTCMNPLNHALNTSSVRYLSVYLSTQMFVYLLFPFRQALSIILCARG